MKLYDFGILVSIGLLALVFLSAVGVTSIHDSYKNKKVEQQITEVE